MEWMCNHIYLFSKQRIDSKVIDEGLDVVV